jgi:hypothetical protein
MDSKVAMLCAPLLVVLLLALFIRCAPKACIPPLLESLRPDFEADPAARPGAWSNVRKGSFLAFDPGESLKAALWALTVAAMDLLSNMILLVLLSREAPYGMFWVAATSLASTTVLDLVVCCRLFTNLGNVRFFWLYILECQELDPEWRKWKNEGKGRARSALRRIKAFKLIKSVTNNAPAYYVQVR